MAKTLSRRLPIVIVWLATALSTVAAEQPKLMLQQAVAAALENNPAQKLAAAGVDAADAAVRRSRAARLPQIGFSEAVTGGNDPVYAFGTKLRQHAFQASDFSLNHLNRPAPITNFATSFSGRWTAFDSLHTRFQIRQALLLRQGAQSSAGRSSQEVIFSTVAAYESVLIANRELEVAAHAVETAQALHDLSRKRVDAGLAVESDALSAQVNLAQRQQELIQAQGSQQTAWAELEVAMSISLPLGPESLEPLSERGFTAATLDEEVEQALENRPDLKSLELQLSAQKAAVASARAGLGPRVDAFGSWQSDRHSFAGTGGSDWLAGAELRIDLLPVEKRAELQQERAALLRARAGEGMARNSIRVEVSRAYFAQQAAGKMLEVARSSMAQAAESLRILRVRYDAGLVSLTDVLRAEDADRQSHSGYWQAVYRSVLSYASLRLATGTLNPDQVVNLQ